MKIFSFCVIIYIEKEKRLFWFMMRRVLEIYIFDTYGVEADYPFEEDFETGVFRHKGSRKWFGIAMNIDYSKIIPGRNGSVDVVNLKCAPEVIESIAGVEPGIFRAYHMNKTHWLTVALDGSCDDETVGWLIGISYDLTGRKPKRGKINEM